MAISIEPSMPGGAMLVEGESHLNGDPTPRVPAAPSGQKGMVLPFIPLHITFKDLSYSIAMPVVTLPQAPLTKGRLIQCYVALPAVCTVPCLNQCTGTRNVR